MKHSLKPTSRKAFTLIELLTVIAIIGILAGILIPVVGSARKSANKAKSKVQFNQYAVALQQYKTEYGYWPPVGGTSGLNSGQAYDISKNADFIKALTGKNTDGSALSTGDRTSLNRKAVAFLSISDDQLYFDDSTQKTDPTKLADAFNNPGIHIAVDHDGDGKIKADVLPTSEDVSAQVVIWTEAGSDKTQNYEDVRSWE